MVKSRYFPLLLALLLCGCSGSNSAVNLTAISVQPSSASVSPGTSKQFQATGRYSDGSTADLTASVTWSSSNQAVATVSNAVGSAGLATGIGAGTAGISATSGGISGSATLTTAALQSIAVSPVNPVSIVGTSRQFSATATLSNGESQDLTGQVLWSTSDPAVATINAAGLASAVGPGTATVTAASGQLSATSTLSVATLVSIALTPVNPSIDTGASQQFTAIGTLSNGSFQEVNSLVSFSSADPAVVAIQPGGLATPLSLGSTLISAAYPGIPVSSTVVTVQGPTSIALTPANAGAVLGSTQQFLATGSFPDGSSHDLTALASWNSSAAAVATISNSAGSRGLASALGNGSTLITATLGVIGSTTLTVKTLSSLLITPATPALGKGATLQFSASGTFSDGSSQELTNLVAWTSSQPAVASISDLAGSKGLLTAHALGQTTITASFAGLSKSSTVNVTPSNEVLVGNLGSNLLSVLDADSSNLLSNVSVGIGPQGVAVDAASSRAYVANSSSGSLSVIDLAGNRQIATVQVGAAPWGVAVHPAAARIYVANSLSANLSVLDAASNKLLGSVAVGANPRGVAVDASANRVYVANSGSNTVSVIDTLSNTLIDTISVQRAPLAVAVDAAGHRAYVTNSDSGTLSVIDTTADSVVATIVVGAGPWGVAVSPATGRAYVANSLSGTLSVIDTVNNAVFLTVAVGSSPRGVALNPVTGRLYLANFAANTVSVLDSSSSALLATIPGFVGPNEIAVIP